jgi:aminoglycoside phosphotransferase (APT) family kinase protein
VITLGREQICAIVERQLGKRYALVGTRISPEGRDLWLLADEGASRIEYVAKAMRDITQGAAARDAQQRFTPERRVCFDRHSGLLVREWIAGESLDRLGPEAVLARMPQVGAALSTLHAFTLPDWPVQGWCDWRRTRLHDLARLTDAVSAQDAALIERALAVADAIDRRHPVRSPPVWLHGDFQLRQLIDTPSGLELIDWDDTCCGEREFDVAYFLAYLHAHFDPTTAQRGAMLFLDGYRRDVPLEAPRLVMWRGYNLLRRALRRQRLQDLDYELERDRMVRQLAVWLEESQTFAG